MAVSQIGDQFTTSGIWIDPCAPNTVYANTNGNLVRSPDAGATWQTLLPQVDVINVTFDAANPGRFMSTHCTGVAYVSTDHGQIFHQLSTPATSEPSWRIPTIPAVCWVRAPAESMRAMTAASTWTAK